MNNDTAALIARAQAALEGTTPGPWEAHGDEPWNMVVRSSEINRVCFMAHSNGDDERDFATARLIASAPTLIADMAAALTAQAAEIARLTEINVKLCADFNAMNQHGAKQDAALAAAEARVAVLEGEANRKQFPILNGGSAKIDWQLVEDHAQQAMSNHGQSVKTLASRGGLSWCELFAVLHNQRWQTINTNEAMLACRTLEARYLAALKAGA